MPSLPFLQADSTALSGEEFLFQTFQVLGWAILFVGLIVFVTWRGQKRRNGPDSRK